MLGSSVVERIERRAVEQTERITIMPGQQLKETAAPSGSESCRTDRGQCLQVPQVQHFTKTADRTSEEPQIPVQRDMCGSAVAQRQFQMIPTARGIVEVSERQVHSWTKSQKCTNHPNNSLIKCNAPLQLCHKEGLLVFWCFLGGLLVSRRRPRKTPGVFEDAWDTQKPMRFPMSFGWFFNVQKRVFCNRKVFWMKKGFLMSRSAEFVRVGFSVSY